MAWDDAKREKAKDLYLAAEPTPDNSMEIVAEIAEELEESVNGVRMILSKLGVYVKKTPAEKSSGSSSGAAKASSSRVSKADAQAKLVAVIESFGGEVDEDIVSKLTGKAALYFAEVFGGSNEDSEED